MEINLVIKLDEEQLRLLEEIIKEVVKKEVKREVKKWKKKT